jgi:sugar phosphate permease
VRQHGHMERYRWVVLALGILAQAAFSAVIQGFPAVGPALKSTYDLSLSELGLVLAALTVGGALTLLPWGLLTDRLGARKTIFFGLGGCAASLALATYTHGVVLLGVALLIAGMLGAVTSVASGRAVMSWFSASQRGAALGLRQTAVPLGGALGALFLPLVASAGRVDGALLVLASACGLAALACGLWLRAPTHKEEPLSDIAPMSDKRIWRLAGATCLLVFTQISTISFIVIFLNEEIGLTPFSAGLLLAAMQIIGAGGRVAVGRWSDHLGRRIHPLRILAMSITIAWLSIVLFFDIDEGVFLVLLVATGALSVSWNGLSFTAAAEYAGVNRSGTALGIQQTVAFAAAALVTPAFGALVEAVGWRSAFIGLAVSPLSAWFVLRPLVTQEPSAVIQPSA